jgi:hypothetical protein
MAKQSLIIKNSTGKLSKNHDKFNKLVTKIAILKGKKEKISQAIEAAKPLVASAMATSMKTSKEETIALATTLDSAYNSFKLSKKQREIASLTICSVLSPMFDADELGILDEQEKKDLHALYTFHNEGMSYEEEITSMNEMQNDFMKNMFGFDMDDLENMSEEEADAAANKFFGYEEPKERKKTQKQLDKEAKQQAAEDKMKKDARTIYTQLAKALHPDTETDEQKREEKTEIMKRVTNAYGSNDLYELLQIQLEVEQLDNDKLANTDDDLMSSYIKVLEKQYNELNDSFHDECKNHPIYEEYFIADAFDERCLKRKIKDIEESIKQVRTMRIQASDTASLKILLKQIEQENKRSPFGW